MKKRTCDIKSKNSTELINNELHRKIYKIHRIHGYVNFDIKDVEYIASSFIRICVSTAKQLANKNFSIVNTIPMIKKVFKIAGLEKLLNVS